ncbi:hypothetical protein DUNSADRAFT_15149, partial [Dunaliella salina]
PATLQQQQDQQQQQQQPFRHQASVSSHPPPIDHKRTGGDRVGASVSRMTGTQQKQQLQADEELSPWGDGECKGLAAAAVAAVADPHKGNTGPKAGDSSAPAPPPRTNNTGRASMASATSKPPGSSSAYETLLRTEALRKRGIRAVQGSAPAPAKPPRSAEAHKTGASMQPQATAQPHSAEQSRSAEHAQSAGGRHSGADVSEHNARGSGAAAASAPGEHAAAHNPSPSVGSVQADGPVVTSFSLAALGSGGARAEDPHSAVSSSAAAPAPGAQAEAVSPQGAAEKGAGMGEPHTEPSVHAHEGTNTPPENARSAWPPSSLKQSRSRAGLRISWGPEAQPHTSDEVADGTAKGGADVLAAGTDSGVLEATLRTPSMGPAVQVPDDPQTPSAADYWLEERIPWSTPPSPILEDPFEWAFRPSGNGSTWGGWGPGATSHRLTESVTAASTELTASAVRALEARLDQLMAGIRGAVQVRKQLSNSVKDGAKASLGSQEQLGLFLRPNEKGINKGMGPGSSRAHPSIPLHPHSRNPPHSSARPTTAAEYTNPAFTSHQASPPSKAHARLHHAHHRPSTPDLVSAAQFASAAACTLPPDSATATPPGDVLATKCGSMSTAYSGTEVSEHNSTMQSAPEAPHIRSPARLLPVVLNISRPSPMEGRRHHHHYQHKHHSPQMELLTPPSSSSSSITASFAPFHPHQKPGSGFNGTPVSDVQRQRRQRHFQLQQQEAAGQAGLASSAAAEPAVATKGASSPHPMPESAEYSRNNGISPSQPAPAFPPSVTAPPPQQPTNTPGIGIPSVPPRGSPSASTSPSAMVSPSNAAARPSSSALSPAWASRTSTATGPAAAVASALAGAPRPGAPPRDLPTLLRQVQAMRQAAESGADPHALPTAWRELQQEVAAAVLAAQEGGQLNQEDQRSLASSLSTDMQALPRPRPPQV